jgi:assimilatory nitrate reductase electron transfer subunit
MRLVVIGHGMAGSRLVEDVRARDPRHRIDITVLGAERHAAYNRILLSDVLAGRTHADDIALAAPGWPEEAGVDLRLGTAATAIDRATRTVRTEDGAELGYDTLVLATGSRPWLPPVAGLTVPTDTADTDTADTASTGGDLLDTGALRPGVTVFRTLGDCREILDAARTARRAVVLGGGLLGLEAARGLTGRGLDVTVLHHMGHLMERQLDPGAGAILRRTLNRLGVAVRTDTTVTGVLASGDRLDAVLLADGSWLETDLLVLACGVRPETDLARGAGLAVDRGVLVDDTLRTATDEHVYAIGECAQHDGQVYGLVAPAWDQARVAADRITGADPTASYTGSRVVTRLKAVGVDLAAMGETDILTDPDPDDETAEVLHFSDPARGTYKKVVLRDGKVTGAILLGQIDTVGTVTQLFDRDAPAPSDRLSLLFADRGAPVPAQTPALMPDRTTVCQCNGVTKGAITACVLAGARTVADVAAATRATTGCGSCRDTVAGITSWLTQAEPDQPAEVTA